MARKSRRANIVQEKKEELHISTSIITRRQLATAAYARLSVDKEKNDESIKRQKISSGKLTWKRRRLYV